MTRYLKLEWRKSSIFSHANLIARERAMNAQINSVVGSIFVICAIMVAVHHTSRAGWSAEYNSAEVEHDSTTQTETRIQNLL